MAEGVSRSGWCYIWVTSALLVLATVTVICRFTVRWRQLQKPGPDDWAMLLSLMLICAMEVEAILWAVEGKIGFRADELTPEQLTIFFQVCARSPRDGMLLT